VEQTGKALVVVGLAIAGIGVLMWIGVFRWLRLGRLPGDIAVERPGFGFYFPITTMLLVSAFLMLIGWLVGLLRR
jgi:hypothetical protein